MLTPSIVLALRSSIRWRINDGSIRPQPHIVLLPSDDAFAVWTDGRPQCSTGDPALACWLLRAERAQPGFVALILDTRTDPETACILDPVERGRILAHQREEAARIRARDAAAEAALREANRRLASGIPSTNPNSLAYKPPASEVDFESL